MINEELVKHISHTFWDISKDAVRDCLLKFTGQLYVYEPRHTGIEAVNAKYPNGWYCERFKELEEDIIIVTSDSQWYYYKLMGWNPLDRDKCFYNAWDNVKDRYPNLTLITRSEYLQLTRDIEPTKRNLDIEQRDWTGVRFKTTSGYEYNLCKRSDGLYGINGSPALGWTQHAVSSSFANGTWIELPPLTTAHNDFQILL